MVGQEDREKKQRGRAWTVRINRMVWDDVVQGVDGEAPLIDLVHKRVDAAMHKRGYWYAKGRWHTKDELRAVLSEAEAYEEASPPHDGKDRPANRGGV